MSHKSFGKNKQQRHFEPITFDFYNEDNLRCRNDVNGAMLLKIIADVDATDDVGRQSEGLLRVFDMCLAQEDKARFSAMVDDPNVEIELADLAETAAWLVSEYTGRPTQEPNGSQYGTGTTPRLSAGAISSQPDVLGQTEEIPVVPPSTPSPPSTEAVPAASSDEDSSPSVIPSTTTGQTTPTVPATMTEEPNSHGSARATPSMSSM